MRKAKTASAKRERRHVRVRRKVSGTQARPRLVVFRSLKHIYAQLVDDTANHTIATVTDQDIESMKKTQKATEVGKRIAERAKAAGITQVVFDRAGYQYHGRVKAVADGAREGGLEF
jgi:large subunit ribosomal protein L18